MKPEEAKAILRLHNPNSGCPPDSKTADALRLVDSDPVLRKWWLTEQANDAAIRQAFQETPVSGGLHERLLQPGTAGKVRAFPRNYHKWLAVAAAACLVIGLTLFSFRRTIIENQLLGHFPELSGMEAREDFRQAMAYYIAHTLVQLDYLSPDLDEVTGWLKERDLPLYSEISDKLASRKTIGCKDIPWRGATVTLICFDSPDNKVIHLFILPKDQAGRDAFADLADHRRAYELNTIGWEDADNAYILVGSDPRVEVRPYVTG